MSSLAFKSSPLTGSFPCSEMYFSIKRRSKTWPDFGERVGSWATSPDTKVIRKDKGQIRSKPTINKKKKERKRKEKEKKKEKRKRKKKGDQSRQGKRKSKVNREKKDVAVWQR